jgi:hypothetical protein
MRRRKSARGLVLAAVNVAVLLGAALIVQSLAAGDPAPSSSSFAVPAEPESGFRAPAGRRTAYASRGPSSASSSSPVTTKRQEPSAQTVPATTESPEAAVTGVEFEEVWYDQSQSAFAPFATGTGSQRPISLTSGYGSPSNAPAYSRRSGSGGGYAGGGGGGFPSGGGGNPRSAQTSQPYASAAGLRASSDGGGASVAGTQLLPTQASNNPVFGGGNPLGAPLFPLASFPGAGFGAAAATNAAATGSVLPNLGGGSTANVTQSQEPVSVPEPSTALLLMGGLAVAAYRSRRRYARRS